MFLAYAHCVHNILKVPPPQNKVISFCHPESLFSNNIRHVHLLHWLVNYINLLRCSNFDMTYSTYDIIKQYGSTK
jgi:hypothetical protein